MGYRTVDIARVCHEAVRALAAVHDDPARPALPAWAELPADQRDELVDQVINTMTGATAQDNHEVWVHQRAAAGWRYGPVVNPATRQHPALTAYGLLSAEQRHEDLLFHAVVNALTAPPGGTA